MDELRALLAALPQEIDAGVGVGLERDVVVVTLASRRSQSIRVRTDGDRSVFTSRVIGRQRVEHYDWTTLARLVWSRNHTTPWVTFMLDGSGRLVGRIELSCAALTLPVLSQILLHLARECDRMEYLLTGEDRH